AAATIIAIEDDGGVDGMQRYRAIFAIDLAAALGTEIDDAVKDPQAAAEADPAPGNQVAADKMGAGRRQIKAAAALAVDIADHFEGSGRAEIELGAAAEIEEVP